MEKNLRDNRSTFEHIALPVVLPEADVISTVT